MEYIKTTYGCLLEDDAWNGAYNHGVFHYNYYETPIFNPIHNEKNPLEFVNFIWEENRKMYGKHDGLKYK